MDSRRKLRLILAVGVCSLVTFAAQTAGTQAPAVTGVSITSSPVSGDTYQLAEIIEVRVTFDMVVRASVSSRLALTIGSQTRQARYRSQSNDFVGGSWQGNVVFGYIVQPSDADADGISVAADALTPTISFLNGDIEANTNLGSHAIANAANHKVDGSQESAPNVIGVRIASGHFGFAYTLADIIPVDVTFDRSVDITGYQRGNKYVVDRGGPRLALTIGSTTRQAHYVSTSHLWHQTVRFHYIVQSSDADADGLSIGASALTLNGGTITARGGAANAALGLGSHAIANSQSHAVRGFVENAPMVNGVYVVSRPASGDTYGSNETIRARVSFDRLTDVTGTPQLALTIGSDTRQAVFVDSDRHVWNIEFVYVVQSSDRDSDGIDIGASALTLNGGTIKIRGGTTDATLNLNVVCPSCIDAESWLFTHRYNVDGTLIDQGEEDGGDGGNTAPSVANELPDLELDVGETTMVDLASAFEDADNDPLHYKAWSNDSSVTVTVVHGMARIRGIRPGAATVTVTATDPEGLRATTTFDVTVGAMLSLSGDAAAPEGGTVVLTATLSRALAEPLDVSWRVVADGDSATPDADSSDYGKTTGETTFAAGETTANIEIAIANDDDIEPAREHFAVALDEPTDANVSLSSSARATAAIQEGVCDRSPAVRDELARNWRGCHWPRPIDLAGITELDLRESGIDALRANDLQGLSALLRLDLDGNSLRALPDGLFAGLGRLREASAEGNPGAPFALEVQLTRTDDDSWASGPATVSARVAVGAPFSMTAPLVATPLVVESEAEVSAPATVRVAAGETTGTTFVVRSTTGAALALRTDAAPMPTTRCGAAACFRGFTTVPGATLTLFHRPPVGLPAPTPEPLQEGSSLRLALDTLVALGDAPNGMRWQASSSDESVARTRIVGADLLVAPEPGGEGAVEITLTATDAFGLATTLRFEVQVEFHWPSDPARGWRATLRMAEDAGTEDR